MQPVSKATEPKKESGRWASDEHERFMAAIATYGKDWKKVEEIVGTRTGSQVRSHAQKFFNKLMKEESQRKSGQVQQKTPQEPPEHDAEESQSFLRYGIEDVSNTSPLELVALIRSESEKDSDNKVNIKSLQNKIAHQLSVIEEQNNEEQLLENLQRQKSYKSMNNILEAYSTIKEPSPHNELQNESFLVRLAKHYKKYFVQDGSFQNLIDFGKPAETEHFEQQARKRSFTLPEGVAGGDSDLEERKKRVISEQQTAKLPATQQQIFRQAAKQRESAPPHEPEKASNQKKE